MNKLLPILALLFSCSVDDFSSKQSNFEEIRYHDMEIFYVGSGIPLDYEIIGDFYIGNSEGCNYDAALNRAADRTKEMGGTAFKIVELKHADSNFGCVRVKGLALRTKKEKCITYYVGWNQRMQSNAASCEAVRGSGTSTSYRCLFETKEECLEIDAYNECVEVLLCE
tara:strand:+ start:657 stop:1160 length:504 start_codon:yes stop_codon:yes gene_type:complete